MWNELFVFLANQLDNAKVTIKDTEATSVTVRATSTGCYPNYLRFEVIEGSLIINSSTLYGMIFLISPSDDLYSELSISQIFESPKHQLCSFFAVALHFEVNFIVGGLKAGTNYQITVQNLLAIKTLPGLKILASSQRVAANFTTAYSSMMTYQQASITEIVEASSPEN